MEKDWGMERKEGQDQDKSENLKRISGEKGARDFRKIIKKVREHNEPVSNEPVSEEYAGKVTSYGQQLRYERDLRGWTPNQLAEELGIPVELAQKWEQDGTNLDLASRQKLSRILGNDFYLTSEVETTRNGTTLQVRIVQWLLTSQDFTTISSVLTRLHTQFWLIQQDRLADLSKYAQTRDSRFVEEANLIITNVTYNSPALLTFLTDPATVTGVVTGTVTLALALQKVVDAIVQARIKIKKAEIDMKNAEVEAKKQQMEFVFEIIHMYADQFYPDDTDQQTKATAMQEMRSDIEANISALLTLKGKPS